MWTRCCHVCVPQIYDHPWYNKNLPPGVKEMNDHPQPLPVGLQSQEEIQKIVAVRRSRCHAACGACFSLLQFPAISSLGCHWQAGLGVASVCALRSSSCAWETACMVCAC